MKSRKSNERKNNKRKSYVSKIKAIIRGRKLYNRHKNKSSLPIYGHTNNKNAKYDVKVDSPDFPRPKDNSER